MTTVAHVHQPGPCSTVLRCFERLLFRRQEVLSARPPLWNSGSPVVAHNQEPPLSDKKYLEIDPDADCISCKIGNDIEATWEKSHI